LSDDDLLRPTLSETRPNIALYNSTGFFVSAFFAGPVGAAIYGGANSYRLNRLTKDVPTLLLIVAAAYFVPYVLHEHGWMQPLSTALGGSKSRNYGLFLRALGLATFGMIYLMHRPFFRAAEVAGTDELPGWRPGIAAVLAGMAANYAFLEWLLKHH
jgi:hypothetical protein